MSGIVGPTFDGDFLSVGDSPVHWEYSNAMQIHIRQGVFDGGYLIHSFWKVFLGGLELVGQLSRIHPVERVHCLEFMGALQKLLVLLTQCWKMFQCRWVFWFRWVSPGKLELA